MNDPIITVEDLGKRYSLRHLRDQRYVALRDVLVEKATGLFRRDGRNAGQRDNKTTGQHEGPVVRSQSSGGPASKEDFWALRNVSFEVRRGEVVGIIGRNGAGKSTLLKILSRITEPTEGRVKLRGRVASLLEVGTGFHPELTGRENIYLNGAILGMSRAEIRAKFDEIVAFAETEKFLDTPVKRYSSGMYVRLAFAVAAHLEPEILVIDEVLAVGDAEFQKKCLGKMREVAEGHGRTVLFVSHNMVAVKNLCTRSLWLEQGRVAKQGNVDFVVAQYLSQAAVAHVQHTWADPQSAPGTNAFRLRVARVYPADASPEITVQTPIVLEFEYWNLVANQKLNLSLMIWNEEGVAVLNTFPVDEKSWHGQPFPVGLFRSRCEIPGNLLNSGMHRVQLYAVRDQAAVLFIADDIVAFDVIDVRDESITWHGRWLGAVRPKIPWATEFLDKATLESTNLVAAQ